TFSKHVAGINTVVARRPLEHHRLSRLADGPAWHAVLRQGATARAAVVMNTSRQGVTAYPDWPLLYARAGVSPDTETSTLAPGEIVTTPLEPAAPVCTGKPARTELKRAMLAPRIVIQELSPSLESRTHLVKRISGEPVDVSARVYMDGHDELGVSLAWRARDEKEWQYEPMTPQGNDVW